MKKELENQQNLERIKVERSYTRPGTASMGRSQMNTQSKMSYQSSSKVLGNGPKGGANGTSKNYGAKGSNQ